jgi:hypothetical protein
MARSGPAQRRAGAGRRGSTGAKLTARVVAAVHGVRHEAVHVAVEPPGQHLGGQPGDGLVDNLEGGGASGVWGVGCARAGAPSHCCCGSGGRHTGSALHRPADPGRPLGHPVAARTCSSIAPLRRRTSAVSAAQRRPQDGHAGGRAPGSAAGLMGGCRMKPGRSPAWRQTERDGENGGRDCVLRQEPRAQSWRAHGAAAGGGGAPLQRGAGRTAASSPPGGSGGARPEGGSE